MVSATKMKMYSIAVAHCICKYNAKNREMCIYNNNVLHVCGDYTHRTVLDKIQSYNDCHGPKPQTYSKRTT